MFLKKHQKIILNNILVIDYQNFAKVIFKPRIPV